MVVICVRTFAATWYSDHCIQFQVKEGTTAVYNSIALVRYKQQTSASMCKLFQPRGEIHVFDCEHSSVCIGIEHPAWYMWVELCVE
jgi:hypothetical protein